MEKVVILSNTSWYIYNFRASLIRALITEKFHVITIAPKDNYTSKLEELGCKHYHIKIDSKSKNPIKDISLTINYLKLFASIKPNVILSFTPKPNIYGALAGGFYNIPSINNIAGLGSGFVKESFTTKLLRFLYWVSQKKASVVFFQNIDDLSDFVNGKIIKKNKCLLLPGSGVDLVRFFATPVPDIQGNKIVFLLISRMLYSKGIELLVSAAKRLNSSGYLNFKVQLLGATGVNSADSISISEIKKWENNSFVEYLGRTDNVQPFIQRAHCIILPSFYREGTPKSLLEGLASGRPIITTKMPGCKETVNNEENGYLIKPNDIEDLIEKMKLFIQLDYNKISNMGVKSRKLAEQKYDEKIVIRSYLNAISNTLSSNKE